MKINSTDLKNLISTAAPAVSQNPTLPILDCFLVQAKDGRVKITGTDLETTIVTRAEILDNAEFAAAIPAKLLTETIKGIPGQPIEITVNDTFAVTIKSTSGKYKMAGCNPADFPGLPEMEDTMKAQIPAESLRVAIDQTHFCASTDELRPAMCGICVTGGTTKTTFVTTDATKLSLCHIYEGSDLNGIIPVKPAKALANILDDKPVSVRANPSHISFAVNGTLIVSRLTDAKYPDYKGVIPKEFKYRMEADKADFLSAIKRIGIFANKNTNQVVLEFSPESVTISASDLDFQNSATEQIPCKFNGNLKIGFNGKMLAECLAAIPSKQFVFEMNDHNKPGIIRPDGNGDLFYLLMPILVSEAG